MALLLFIIYIIFISLGLPDALLGSAWPAMYKDINVSIGFASVISTITLLSTAGISFVSGGLIRKWGTYKVVAVSILATIIGMLGIALAPNIFILILFAVILGLGGGVIDAALNSFVSIHFEAKHINFLHACWGIGVTLSPIIISIFIKHSTWRYGYISVVILQCLIMALVLINREQWKRIKENLHSDNSSKKQKHAWKQISKKKGLLPSVLSCGCYSGLEFTLNVWITSFLVKARNLSPDTAALWLSLYCGGIMLGRIISGFASNKLKDSILKQIGFLLCGIGLVLMFFQNINMNFVGVLLLGLGSAPIYPAQLHSVPFYFGEEYTADITGLHMAVSYTLGVASQLGFGVLVSLGFVSTLPYALAFILIVMWLLTLKLNSSLRKEGIRV